VRLSRDRYAKACDTVEHLTRCQVFSRFHLRVMIEIRKVFYVGCFLVFRRTTGNLKPKILVKS